VRREMAEVSGNPGNSCMHLTDPQEDVFAAAHAGDQIRMRQLQTGKGHGCDASYAFACARCLLEPAAMQFLNETCADPAFREAPHFDTFTDWLVDPSGSPWPGI
jgi:hypothetical protein